MKLSFEKILALNWRKDVYDDSKHFITKTEITYTVNKKTITRMIILYLRCKIYSKRYNIELICRFDDENDNFIKIQSSHNNDNEWLINLCYLLDTNLDMELDTKTLLKNSLNSLLFE